jgi:hypothetical protein
VQEAVTELPEDLRPCVELRYFGGLSLEEAASSLGVGLTTLKGRLKEAREILRQKLAPLSGAFILPFLSGESEAAVPTIRVSASLEEKLEFLQRDGTAAARLAAGGAISSARAARLAAAAVLFAATAGWLFLGGPSRREQVQAPAVATARVEARVPAGRPQEVPPSIPGGAGLEEESDPAVKTAVEMKPYRLLDKEGKPIPGAHIAIIAQEAIRWEGESDPEGGFDLPESLFEARAELGSYGSLKSKKEGFYSTTRVLLNRPAPGYELVMERSREVTIRVLRGMDRMPVTRYAVRYDPVLNEYRSSEEGPFKDPPLEVEVEDPEGTFRFTPTNHFWRENVTVTVEGHDPLPGRQFVNLESYQQNELVFLLKSPGELWGWVVDPAGQPLAGAEVYTSNRRQPIFLEGKDWTPAKDPQRQGAQKVLSASDGSFRTRALPNETWLVARHGELVPAVFRVPATGPGGPSRLVVGQGGGLEVRRLDADDRPIAGEEVEVHLVGLDEEPLRGLLPWQLQSFLPFSTRFGQQGFTSVTDAEGAARFDHLPPGYYQWMQRGTWLQVRAGEVEKVVDRDPLREDLETPPSGRTRVFGSIQVGGKPMANPSVFIARRQVTTDAEGRFELNLLQEIEKASQEALHVHAGKLPGGFLDQGRIELDSRGGAEVRPRLGGDFLTGKQGDPTDLRYRPVAEEDHRFGAQLDGAFPPR